MRAPPLSSVVHYFHQQQEPLGCPLYLLCPQALASHHPRQHLKRLLPSRPHPKLQRFRSRRERFSPPAMVVHHPQLGE